MDVWDQQQQQLPELPHVGRHRKQNPSFSSSLLDAVYRSIDETNGVEGEEQLILYRETMRKKQSIIGFKDADDEHDRLNFRRACMIEKWMEKKVSEKVVVRRSSMADFDRKARNVRDRDHRDHRDHRDFKKLMNSSSSSSESSSGGGFSSSESETRSSSYTMQRPRPIRTEKTQFDGHGDGIQVSIPNDQKPKHENGFVKTKSKALKIYGDLKKVKQPISPGGRLATFLNSLFNGGSPKKQKFTDSAKPNDACMRKSKSAQASTCSSASSFSRSCLSKTPSSGEKLINNGSTKRSVRFCPVSVILDEDSRPCGHKSLQDELGLIAAATTLRNALRNDHCRSEEASEDLNHLMNSYQKKINGDVYINREEEDEDEDDDDDEDAVSCSSSDLFELDNLSSIGIERYREELPVYETTHFSTNQAIANGLILY